MTETKPKAPRTQDPDVRRITELARTVKQLAQKVRAAEAAEQKASTRANNLNVEYKQALGGLPDPMRDYLHTTVGLGKPATTEAS